MQNHCKTEKSSCSSSICTGTVVGPCLVMYKLTYERSACLLLIPQEERNAQANTLLMVMCSSVMIYQINVRANQRRDVLLLRRCHI